MKINVNALISAAERLGTEYEVIEGCLIDNYVFYNVNEWASDDLQLEPRHLIVKETYLNEWSSEHLPEFTSCINAVNNFKNERMTIQ